MEKIQLILSEYSRKLVFSFKEIAIVLKKIFFFRDWKIQIQKGIEKVHIIPIPCMVKGKLFPVVCV